MPWGPGGYTPLTTPVGSDSAYIEGWRTWQRAESLRASGQATLPDSSRTIESLDPYNDPTGYAFWYLGFYLRTARGDASGPRMSYLTVVAPQTGAFVETARNMIVQWTEQLNATFPPPAASAVTYQTPIPTGTPPGVQTVAAATAIQLNAQAGIIAQQAAQAAQIQAAQQAAQLAAQQEAERQRQAQLAEAQRQAAQLAAQQEAQRQAQLAATAARQEAERQAQQAIADNRAAEIAAQQAADRIAAAQQLAAEAQRQQATAQTIAEQAAARQASDVATVALASAQRDAERAASALVLARASVQQTASQVMALPSVWVGPTPPPIDDGGDTLFGFDKKLLLVAAGIAAVVFLFKE